ncbi:MAG: NAD-dependent epimerase/dehydratase family protein [Clostridiales Family XIII bacterium]|jgi:nucleoside-diphosphate-sugar epimerase|nr:NAD-dependent epimerase/dehydratase family protein [Clostridiales Family XIII bacterium]
MPERTHSAPCAAHLPDLRASNPVIEEDAAQVATDLSIDEIDALSDACVLVAGGGGMTARHLCCALLAANRLHGTKIRVVSLVRDLPKAQTFFGDQAGIRLIQGTLGAPGAPLPDLGAKPDFIVHAGGASSPFAYQNDPVGVIRANVAGALDLSEVALRSGTRRLVFLSSREVYGNTSPDAAGGRISEDADGRFDHLSPRNAYPESKRMAESILGAYETQHGLAWNALRLASVYGPGMPLSQDGRAMSDMVAAVLRGEDIRLRGDGSPVRAWCYVSDAVLGILRCMLSGAPGTVYNIADETDPHSIRDAARLLLSLPGCGTSELRLEGTDPRYSYSSFSYAPLDVGRASAIGWSPRVAFQTGLERTLAAYRYAMRDCPDAGRPAAPETNDPDTANRVATQAGREANAPC